MTCETRPQMTFTVVSDENSYLVVVDDGEDVVSDGGGGFADEEEAFMVPRGCEHVLSLLSGVDEVRVEEPAVVLLGGHPALTSHAKLLAKKG